MIEFTVTGEWRNGRTYSATWRDGLLSGDEVVCVHAREAVRAREPVSIPGVVYGLASLGRINPPLALATLINVFPEPGDVRVTGDAFLGWRDDPDEERLVH